MSNDTKPTRKPRKARQTKSTTATNKAAAQATAQTSQPSSSSPQIVGHYQAVLPPTKSGGINIGSIGHLHPEEKIVTNEETTTQTDAPSAAESQAITSPESAQLTPMIVFVRSTQVRGFWRCGLHFSHDGIHLGVHPKDDKEQSPFLTEDGHELPSVTYEQYKRLLNESRLAVEEA